MADAPPAAPGTAAAAAPVIAPGVAGGRWVSIAEAARLLGVRRQSVQKRIARGTLETREERDGNRHRLLVRVPDPLPQQVPQRVPESGAHPVPDRRDTELAELRATVVGLQALVEAQRQHITDVRGELTAERARVDKLLEQLAERPRRRWRWWRRGG